MEVCKPQQHGAPLCWVWCVLGLFGPFFCPWGCFPWALLACCFAVFQGLTPRPAPPWHHSPIRTPLSESTLKAGCQETITRRARPTRFGTHLTQQALERPSLFCTVCSGGSAAASQVQRSVTHCPICLHLALNSSAAVLLQGCRGLQARRPRMHLRFLTRQALIPAQAAGWCARIRLLITQASTGTVTGDGWTSWQTLPINEFRLSAKITIQGYFRCDSLSCCCCCSIPLP